jgi:hypothetical protein
MEPTMATSCSRRKAGRFLGRRHEGHLGGPLTMKGAQGELKMMQSIEYTITTDAVR